MCLIREIEHRDSLEAAGETAIERRGLVAPRQVLAAWTFEILEVCHESRIPPPWELVCVVYALLGCSHLETPRGKPQQKAQFFSMRNIDPSLSLRGAARKLGVNVTTIKKWSDASHERGANWAEERKKISERMGVEDFYPPTQKQLVMLPK